MSELPFKAAAAIGGILVAVLLSMSYATTYGHFFMAHFH